MIKKCLVLLWILLFNSTCFLMAQPVSGKWKGYFVESDFRQFEQRYNVELEIEVLPMNVIRCTTTIYKKKIFQSQSTGLGIINKNHQYIIFSENKFLTLNDSLVKEPCFVAFQLQYKSNGIETLTGIFRSKKGSTYCSEGKVYVRKFIPQEVRKKIRQDRKEKRLNRKEKRKMRKETN